MEHQSKTLTFELNGHTYTVKLLISRDVRGGGEENVDVLAWVKKPVTTQA